MVTIGHPSPVRTFSLGPSFTKMPIDNIAKALSRSPSIDEWVVREVRERHHSERITTPRVGAKRQEHRYHITVWRDRRGARGEARMLLAARDHADFASMLAHAADRAFFNLGPAWRLPLPAAPTRVQLADARLSEDPESVVAELSEIVREVRGVMPEKQSDAIHVQERLIRIRTSTGADFSSEETMISAEVLLSSQKAELTHLFEIRVRTTADLDFRARLDAAKEAVNIRSTARELTPGLYDLVIAHRALLRAGGRMEAHWLSPLAHHADAVMVRRGLARYRPGEPLFDHKTSSGDVINVDSDGSIDYAAQSAAFGFLGGPVRRFRLVDKGVAANLALGIQEASLAKKDANGGARNLHLGSGSHTLDQLASGQRPRLLITEMDWLEVNLQSGDIVAQIGLIADDHSQKGVRGGTFSFNLFAALARLRISREMATEARMTGPAWIGIPAVWVR